MQIPVVDTRDGKTVLDVIKKELRLSSKTLAFLKKRENGITVDGTHVTVRHILRAGEVLSLDISDADDGENENLVPTDLPLDIICEDDDIIALNKPPYMPTHPSHGHFDDTLANALCFYMRNVKGEPFVFRAVSRLDRCTSGIILVAKNRVSACKLCDAMQKHNFSKEYLAVLSGTPEKDEGVIETYIRRREKSIITREVCKKADGGDYALTRYKVIAKKDGFSLVRAFPVTGRTHQLRVHFSHIGCPILGDDLYGSPSNLIGRQALHAFSLSFPHPTTGRVIRLEAPLPPDMKDLYDFFV